MRALTELLAGLGKREETETKTMLRTTCRSQQNIHLREGESFFKRPHLGSVQSSGKNADVRI